jgi:DNA-binding CsgD family transcriptional regulator
MKESEARKRANQGLDLAGIASDQSIPLTFQSTKIACALEVGDLVLDELYDLLPESAPSLAKNWRGVPGHCLTLNECCVLVCAAACLSYVEIANIRGVSKASVRNSFKLINYKLQADSIKDAVSLAVAKGIIIPNPLALLGPAAEPG